MTLSSRGRSSCNFDLFYLKSSRKMQWLFKKQNIQQNIQKTFFWNFWQFKKKIGGHLGFLWFVRKVPKLELSFIQIRNLQPLRILKLSLPLNFFFVKIRNIHDSRVLVENPSYLAAILDFDLEEKPSPRFLHNLRKI